MKKLLVLLALLLAPSLCFGLSPCVLGSGNTVAAAGGVCSNCDFDFEGSGAPTGWSDANGSPNWDYSSSGLDMCNDEVVELGAGEDAEYNHADGSAHYYTFQWRYDDGIDVNNEWVFVGWTSGTSEYKVVMDADETMECKVTGDTDSGLTVFSTDTTYHFKVYVKASDGGNNGTISLWIWNGSSWDLECSTAVGTNTGNIVKAIFYNSQDTETQWFDCVRYDTSDITEP